LGVVIPLCVVALLLGIERGPAGQAPTIPLPTDRSQSVIFSDYRYAWTQYDAASDRVRVTLRGDFSVTVNGRRQLEESDGRLVLAITKANDHHALVSVAHSCMTLFLAHQDPSGFTVVGNGAPLSTDPDYGPRAYDAALTAASTVACWPGH
jgi:hypothetical protein